ncbi:MAG: beta-ketoacyl-ACP synthase II [Chloroflexi bacterium]|nr:beta-ketoacyl-ACP synthase II [Chloroflexota bacterium]
MRNNRRVVVTGLGALTPLGLSVEETWGGLLAGRSGIDRITLFDPSSYSVQIAGEVKGFDPQNYLDAKETRRMARFSQFAVAAARMALKDAGYTPPREEADQVGVVIGTGIGGGLTEAEEAHLTLLEKGGRRISPLFIPNLMPNAAAYQISYLFGLRGYNATVVTACASGTQAIGEATKVIRDGDAEAMLAGGSEAALCELGLAGLLAMRALSSRNEEPAKASRPFDKERDGFVAGEGAGILVLESIEHAVSRGARIYGEVLGYGVSADAYHVTAPEPSGMGAALAMQRALQHAHINPEEIDYINAHATATPLGDVAETVAIKRVFGEQAYNIRVSATKSMIGHLIGAAGAVEAIASILSIRDQIIHPTINYTAPDPECDLDCVPNVARRAEVDKVLSNSFGFGGQNASLVLGRYQE